MKRFVILTHVKHTLLNGKYYAYAPYVKELNLWLKHVDEVILVAPVSEKVTIDPIEIAYEHDRIRFIKVPSFHTLGLLPKLITFLQLPYIMIRIFGGMWAGNHIHIRCPGNMGLVSAFVQILFPFKKKTVKYAGNWDPSSIQPLSYRIQKTILSNSLISRNTRILVYGDWKSRSKNVLPFFTASFKEADKQNLPVRSIEKSKPVEFIFVGTLAPGKRPLLAIQIVHALLKHNVQAQLNLYGSGELHDQLERYIADNRLENYIHLRGNLNQEALKKEYQQAHFLFLLSKSEGWPKVVTEAMWWGCVPVVTPVSCVPWMIGENERGILIHDQIDSAVAEILHLIENPDTYRQMATQGMNWSRDYTLEKFEKEITALI